MRLVLQQKWLRLKVESRYPAGVYNLIVTQGEHVKTLRVIKRETLVQAVLLIRKASSGNVAAF